MKKRNNRLVLPLIIILLIIFLPFGLTGLGNKLYQVIRGDNPEHLHKIDNTLYYYNGKKLIGTYNCKSVDCDSASSIIDDDKDFDYYHDATTEALGVFNEGYIFIQDGYNLELYNLNTKVKIGTFKAYKSYGTKISDTYIILQDTEGQFGLFDINNVVYYNDKRFAYIGVSNDMINASPEELRLVAKDVNNNYSIIDREGEAISASFKDKISNYDEFYVYTKVDKQYHIYDYNNEELLKAVKISKIDHYDDFIIITNVNGDIIIYPADLTQESIKRFNNNNKEISYIIEDDIMTIKDSSGNVVDTYAFHNDEQPEEETSEE